MNIIVEYFNFCCHRCIQIILLSHKQIREKYNDLQVREKYKLERKKVKGTVIIYIHTETIKELEWLSTQS